MNPDGTLEALTSAADLMVEGQWMDKRKLGRLVGPIEVWK